MRSFADWPAEDQERWNQAFKPTDRFEETSLGAHLAPATRKNRRESYGRFLGFIAAFYPGRLAGPPDTRIDRATLAEYVAWRSRSSEKSALVCDLRALRVVGDVAPRGLERLGLAEITIREWQLGHNLAELNIIL